MRKVRRIATLLGLAGLLAFAACGPRNLVRYRVFDRPVTKDAFVVAEGPSTLLALDRALEEGRDHCLAQGKEFERLEKFEAYQGKDRTGQIIGTLLGENIGPRYRNVVERQDYRVELLFRCVSPDGEESPWIPPAVPTSPKLAPEPAVPAGPSAKS